MSDRGQVPPNGDESWHSRVPPALARWGLSAWLILGTIALAVVVYFGLVQISSLLVPLIVAIVIGMLFSPVVDRLTRAGLPPFLAASLVLVGLIAVTALSIFLAVKGIYDQRDLIAEQFSSGWDMVQVWLAERGISLDSVDQAVQSLGAGATSGAGEFVQAGLSSVFSFIIGLLIGVFLLFYVLKDWHVIRDWVANHLGQIPPDLGAGIINDATRAIRSYFAGLAITAAPVAIIIGVAMLLLDIPLAFTVILVTFVTSFIPYLGAIVSGAFAVLVALGAAGVQEAIIILIVVLVAQNVVQTLMLTKVTSDKLRIHPIVNLGSTVVGATLAGVVGATLSAPVVATAISVSRRISQHRNSSEES
ncbi:MAG: AI-2E family transporter [Actinomycetia bacterium]|nr:AI-2E family transporter [Actinomycetes bacterium]